MLAAWVAMRGNLARRRSRIFLLHVDAGEALFGELLREIPREEALAHAHLEHRLDRARLEEEGVHLGDEAADQRPLHRVSRAVFRGLEPIEVAVGDHSPGSSRENPERLLITNGLSGRVWTISSAMSPVAKICTPTTTKSTPRLRSGRCPMASPMAFSTAR